LALLTIFTAGASESELESEDETGRLDLVAAGAISERLLLYELKIKPTPRTQARGPVDAVSFRHSQARRKRLKSLRRAIFMASRLLTLLTSHWRFLVFVLLFYIIAFAVFSLFLFLALSSELNLRWISVGVFLATILGFAVATVVYAPVRAKLRKEYHIK
jgi:hypothetical protein